MCFRVKENLGRNQIPGGIGREMSQETQFHPLTEMPHLVLLVWVLQDQFQEMPHKLMHQALIGLVVLQQTKFPSLGVTHQLADLASQVDQTSFLVMVWVLTQMHLDGIGPVANRNLPYKLPERYHSSNQLRLGGQVPFPEKVHQARRMAQVLNGQDPSPQIKYLVLSQHHTLN